MTTQTSCPCPRCFKCCCHDVEGLNPADCVNGDEGTCECEKGEFAPVLVALLATENPPTNYALTEGDVASIAAAYDWESRVDESNWSRNTSYETLAEMVAAEPNSFLADISRYYGDDQYLDLDAEGGDEDDYDDQMDGDAESALASAGWGTDEDYGCFGGEDF